MFDFLFSKNGFSHERLRTFVEVAKAGNISRAANRDVVRQSLYSKQIRDLEEFFNARLMLKKGNDLILTEKGSEILRVVTEYFYAMDSIKRACADTTVTVNIGATDSAYIWILLPFAAESAAIEGLSLNLARTRNEDIQKKLLPMELDIGLFFSYEKIQSKRIAHKVLKKIKYSYYVSKKLIKKYDAIDKPFDWYERNVPFAIISNGACLCKTKFNDHMLKDISPRLITHVEGFPDVMELVKGGEYLGILPDLAEKFLGDEIVKLNFRTNECEFVDMILAWNVRAVKTKKISEEVLSMIKKFKD